MKVEVDLAITNPITSNNFCKSLIDLRVGYISQHNQYYAAFTNRQTAPSFFHLPARSASGWQGMFFIYICVISHEFVSASLKKPCGFFPWFLIPLILFLSQLWPKGSFILRQMTLELMLVYSFINFVIPLHATLVSNLQ